MQTVKIQDNRGKSMREIKKGLGAVLLSLALLPGARAVAQELVLQPPPMERAFGGRMLHGRWWDNPKTAQQIGLTADQQKKMDDIFQQNRLKLIDLSAALEKQEVIMQPLMEADQPDEGKILAQIDAIAQARAELEKNNARMLLEIRKVLTPDQWKKVKELQPEEKRVFIQRFSGGGREFHKGDGPPPLPQMPDGGPGRPAQPPQ
jgi:Spy/CpxP family protein refolding chaperone